MQNINWTQVQGKQKAGKGREQKKIEPIHITVLVSLSMRLMLRKNNDELPNPKRIKKNNIHLKKILLDRFLKHTIGDNYSQTVTL